MSRRPPLPRLAVLVLASLASAPLLVAGGHWLATREARLGEAERNRVVLRQGGGAVASEIPRGMRIETSGFGTVLDAPEAVANIGASSDEAPTRSPGAVAASVRRFIRALPSPAPAIRRSDQPIVCTAEGPPVWHGRLVLIDGCLRVHHGGANEPGPLILARTELHLDADGYLAASLGVPGAENQVRIGAPQVQFVGVGCSMDHPVEAPSELAKACGVEMMQRVGQMRRRHYCTPEELEERKRREEENRAMQRRIAQQRQTCLARGTPPGQCPPGAGPALPPPPPGSPGACVPRRS